MVDKRAHTHTLAISCRAGGKRNKKIKKYICLKKSEVITRDSDESPASSQSVKKGL